MENRAHLLAAGLFVLIFSAAAAWAFWWFVGRQEATHTYLLETRGSVVGLNREAPVRFRGIRAGKVRDLYTDPGDPGRLLVEITVADRFRLTDRTVARLAPQGLTGMSYVLLEEGEQGAGKPLPTDGTARLPLQAGLVETLSRQASELGERLLVIATRAERLLSEENVGRIASILVRVDESSRTLAAGSRVLQDLREILTENRTRLSASLAHLERAAAASPGLVEGASQTLAGLVRLEARLEKLAERHQRIAERLDEEALPEATAVLQETRALSAQLSRLVRELEHDPALAWRGRASLPGPGEAGFVYPEKAK